MLCLMLTVEALTATGTTLDDANAAGQDTVVRTLRHRRTAIVVNNDSVGKAAPEKTAKQHAFGDDPTIYMLGDSIAQDTVDTRRLSLIGDSITDFKRPMPDSLRFNPDPGRALWLSALCPGLGQIYNRRFWKLPIVVGAFVGLAYGTSWNQRMLNDYTRAYRDAVDDDPDTRSYMDFYPPTTKEEDINMEWLQRALKNKKNYYRRYRDICILSMVGVYLINLIDAYVDASLAHFDISPDLSMNVKPAIVTRPDAGLRSATVGLQCAFTF